MARVPDDATAVGNRAAPFSLSTARTTSAVSKGWGLTNIGAGRVLAMSVAALRLDSVLAN